MRGAVLYNFGDNEQQGDRYVLRKQRRVSGITFSNELYQYWQNFVHICRLSQLVLKRLAKIKTKKKNIYIIIYTVYRYIIYTLRTRS